MNKKVLYLGTIVTLLLVLTGFLFYQKSLILKSEAGAAELQKALLTYIEKEEVYPKSLKEIKFNHRGLEVIYEVLENGQGCRFTVGTRTIELWDEKR